MFGRFWSGFKKPPVIGGIYCRTGKSYDFDVFGSGLKKGNDVDVFGGLGYLRGV